MPEITRHALEVAVVTSRWRSLLWPAASGLAVALTFDDGPGRSTASIRKVLRRYGVAASFFNLGDNAAARPGQVRDEARAGYLLGSRTGTGYLVASSNGGVHRFGALRHGSMAGRLPAGVTSAGLATDSFTGGYWFLESNGGVDNFHAPWRGSVAGKLPGRARPIAIAGQ
jgi:polysaccharide deacetylase